MLTEFLAPVLALAAAFLFAIGAQFQNLGLPNLDSRGAASISITTAALYFWILAPFMLDPSLFLAPAVLIFIAIGLFRPSVSANLAITGMRYLGPTLATTLSSTAPLFGMAMGILWLGEELTWQTGTGTLVIVAAVALLARKGGGAATSWPVWALAFPVGAAFIRSLGHVLSKIGMNEIPDPYFAGLVTFSVSSVIAICMHRMRRSPPAIPWAQRTPFWHVAAGSCFATAILCLNNALLIGEIIIVVPIVAASPIFTLLLSVLLFRRERITPRVVLAVFMVVPAVALIAISR